MLITYPNSTNKRARVDKINLFQTRPEFRQLKRKNNDIVAACYALYVSGKSLAYIAQVHYKGRFTRQSLYCVFRVRGYPLRSKRMRPARTYKGLVYFQDSAGLYRHRSKGKTVYLHRLMWEEKNGPVPAGHCVIFSDGDKENIRPENLRCLPTGEAKKIYNHANQFGFKRFPGKGAFGK